MLSSGLQQHLNGNGLTSPAYKKPTRSKTSFECLCLRMMRRALLPRIFVLGELARASV